MIKNISIHNFQSHKDTELELHPGVNIFTGNSDCGKSAILRALTWCITNDPQGDYFISDWCRDSKGKVKGTCSVSLDNVTRARGSDVNNYSVDDDTFEALRGEVPNKVKGILNLGDVNIQRQLDGPFMLSNTPGENARMVNELVNLTDIDTSLSWVSSQSKECTSTIKVNESRRMELESQLVDENKLQEVKNSIKELSALSEKISIIEEKTSTMEELINQYEGVKIYDTGRLERIVQDLGDALQRGTLLSQLVDERSKELAAYGRLGLLCIVPELQLGRIERTGKLMEELGNAVYELEPLLQEYSRLSGSIGECEKEVSRLTEEISGMACPMCGRIGLLGIC